ncbi:SpoIIE family protein phosphatase [Streptomyces sp. NRRL B-1677]|uniref:PP2C family protein-serine/threonine phosphatase n=1 Tax=Streptomyces sp. NRRL B-1677 TaxID=2682966 RepID=UPI001892BF92|nr:PP2C family protein-serine/threonine phosphatase [Streptomyces sp. NRRL B-1677]MBF6046648.1 SpoIIE family protein phosphatase [Streptomyces sp. NRRL B-1677]
MRIQFPPAGARLSGGRRALLAAPLGLIAVIMVADLSTGPDIHLGPLLVAAPALTATFGSARLTAAIGAVAVAAQIVLGLLFGRTLTADHQTQTAALFLATIFLVAFRAVHERREQALDRARWVADVAQKVLLKPLPAQIGLLELASAYVAAEAEAQIGGDLYAAVRARDATRLLIGDSRGKGFTAVGDAALLLGAFHAAAHRFPPLPRLVAHLHNTVYWDAEEPADDLAAGESFITAAVLEIPDGEPRVHVIDCGHPPPILVRGGEVVPLEIPDPYLPLGLGAPTTEKDYEADTFEFPVGALLLLYTDGVIEARDAHGTFYPLTERLASWGERDPRSLVRRLHEDLLDHAGGSLGDDAALIAIRRKP